MPDQLLYKTMLTMNSRKRDRDGAFSLKKANKGSRRKQSTDPDKENATLLRLSVKKHHIMPDGSAKPIFTTMMINRRLLDPNVDPTKAAGVLIPELEKSPYYRPVAEVLALSSLGSPEKVTTPTKKNILVRVLKLRDISLFSTDPDLIPHAEIKTVTDIAPNSPFFKTQEYAALKAVTTTMKLQSTPINESLLKKAKQEKDKDGGIRPVSQQSQMVNENVSAKKGSAKQYAGATRLFNNDMRWEWLHLIAYMILGSQSQHEKNLVGGSFQANADMTIIESEMNYLAKAYPAGFNLTVEADLIPGTQIATEIRYRIKTPDFEFPLDFNAQNPNQPHISYHHFVHSLLKTLVALAMKTTSSTPPASPSTFKTPFPFFEKTEAALAKEKKAELMKLQASKSRITSFKTRLAEAGLK